MRKIKKVIRNLYYYKQVRQRIDILNIKLK